MATTMEPGPDLMALGTHCSVVDCRQLDFLPFNCQHCKHTFCLEHRQPAQHNCTASAPTNVVLCPLCAKAIRVQPGEDANAAWERHNSTGACDPANYAAVHAKRTCPVQGCREKLTTSNKYTCRDCGKEVCLKHRFATSHACAKQQQQRRTGTICVWGGACAILDDTLGKHIITNVPPVCTGPASSNSASRLLAAWTGNTAGQAPSKPAQSPSSSGASKVSEWFNKLSFGGGSKQR